MDMIGGVLVGWPEHRRYSPGMLKSTDDGIMKQRVKSHHCKIIQQGKWEKPCDLRSCDLPKRKCWYKVMVYHIWKSKLMQSGHWLLKTTRTNNRVIENRNQSRSFNKGGNRWGIMSIIVRVRVQQVNKQQNKEGAGWLRSPSQCGEHLGQRVNLSLLHFLRSCTIK